MLIVYLLFTAGKGEMHDNQMFSIRGRSFLLLLSLSLSVPLLSLRVAEASPTRFPLCSGGFAGRRGRGCAAQAVDSSGRVCFSCSLSHVASWSRVLDPIGRIWCVLALLFAAAQLRWQELWQAAVLRQEIFANKVVFPVFSSLPVLVLWRAVGRWWLCISYMLPRRNKVR